MASPNYLPSCWNDDQRMSALMSMFKRRDVNPTEFDAKMRFWTEAITSSSRALKNPVFTLKQLGLRFQRKDRLPAGLEIVLRNMIDDGVVQEVTDFTAESNRGWIGWGVDVLVKRPLSWIWGGLQGKSNEPDIKSTEFIVAEVVEEIGEEILRRRRHALEDNDDDNPLAEDVISWSVFRRIFSHDSGEWRQVSDRALELALIYLKKENQIAVAQNGSEKMIKFKVANETEPPKVTETDQQIANVKRATEKLESDLTSLEQQVERFDQEARVQLRAGNRAKAKACLRQKLQALKRLKDKENAYENLTGLMHQLVQTKEQKTIFDAYKAGVTAFKNSLAQNNLSPSKIDETMDDIQEVLNDHEEIKNAISMGPVGFGGYSDQSQAELEQELDDLLESEKAVEDVLVLPDVPTHTEKRMDDQERSSQDDRLKRLRRALEEAA